MYSLARTFHISPALIRLFFIAAVACSLFAFVVPKAQASGLTEAQIQAVLGVLSSFNVDQATITNVNAALHGQAQAGATDGVVTNSTPANPSTGASAPLVCPVYQTTACPSGAHRVDGATTYDSNNCAVPNWSCVADSASTPAPTLSATPTSGVAPLGVVFVSNTNGTINFGDGTSGQVQSCYQLQTYPTQTRCTSSHTYTTAGTYTASITTAGSCASGYCAQATSVTITVTGSGVGASTALVCPVYQMSSCPAGQHQVVGTPTYDSNNCAIPNVSCVSDGGVSAPGIQIYQSADYAGMMAAAIAAPFGILIDSLTDLFVYAGIGQ